MVPPPSGTPVVEKDLVMRKSILIGLFGAAIALGLGADRLLHRSPAESVIPVAQAATPTGSAAQASTPVQAPVGGPSITLSDGRRLDSETLGPIIEQYLLDHPELLARVVAKLQQKEEAAARAQGKTAVAAARDELLNDPAAPVLGNPQGDVTVVEFFDYKCPYCKRVADDVTRLIVDDPKVRVVFKEFPILGPDSQIAALGGLAANHQGKYAAYHKAAMEHRGAFSEDVVVDIAKGLGLDLDRFKADLKDEGFLAAIKKNQALAEKLGIDGTPAFVIGQDRVTSAISYDDMKKMVDAARKSGS